MYFANVNIEYLETKNNVYVQLENINPIPKGVASLKNDKNLIIKAETYCLKPLKMLGNMILAIKLLINWFILKKFISSAAYISTEFSKIQNMITYIINQNLTVIANPTTF